MRPDINCDLGEGIGNDALIIPFITSANIACGYHAGDIDTMHQTIAICLKHNVSIGAHPSFLDRENFGRTEINLPVDDLYELLTQQLIIFSEVADIFDKTINHVKPHGALYNMSAKDAFIANIIAKAVNDFDSNLILYGLSGSHSISEANRMGLKTASEVFADRTYQDDGSLTPRSKHDALIIDADKMIPIKAETICIHGDGKHAVEFAKAIHKLLSV